VTLLPHFKQPLYQIFVEAACSEFDLVVTFAVRCMCMRLLKPVLVRLSRFVQFTTLTCIKQSCFIFGMNVNLNEMEYCAQTPSSHYKGQGHRVKDHVKPCPAYIHWENLFIFSTNVNLNETVSRTHPMFPSQRSRSQLGSKIMVKQAQYVATGI
jgi:hypothetical protein